MKIVRVTVTPIAFRDPPLLNASGIHEPFALRSIIEIESDNGYIGLGESYGDAPALAIQHAAPHIKTRGGGSIICTASVAGLRSGAGGPAYSASKAGVINLAMVSAQQLCETGVRVNAICPGLTETGMTAPTFNYAKDKGVTHKLGRLNPLRRAG